MTGFLPPPEQFGPVLTVRELIVALLDVPLDAELDVLGPDGLITHIRGLRVVQGPVPAAKDYVTLGTERAV